MGLTFSPVFGFLTGLQVTKVMFSDVTFPDRCAGDKSDVLLLCFLTGVRVIKMMFWFYVS